MSCCSQLSVGCAAVINSFYIPQTPGTCATHLPSHLTYVLSAGQVPCLCPSCLFHSGSWTECLLLTWFLRWKQQNKGATYDSPRSTCSEVAHVASGILRGCPDVREINCKSAAELISSEQRLSTVHKPHPSHSHLHPQALCSPILEVPGCALHMLDL